MRFDTCLLSVLLLAHLKKKVLYCIFQESTRISFTFQFNITYSMIFNVYIAAFYFTTRISIKFQKFAYHGTVLTSLESFKALASDFDFPFPSLFRRNLEKKFGDCDGDGVVTLRELVETWEDVDDPDTSRILARGSMLPRNIQ